jgi:hypothetical protein
MKRETGLEPDMIRFRLCQVVASPFVLTTACREFRSCLSLFWQDVITGTQNRGILGKSNFFRFPTSGRPTGSTTAHDKNEPAHRGCGRHSPRTGQLEKARFSLRPAPLRARRPPLVRMSVPPRHRHNRMGRVAPPAVPSARSAGFPVPTPSSPRRKAAPTA